MKFTINILIKVIIGLYMKKKAFLEKQFVKDFREEINRFKIFSSAPEFKEKWNFICTVMDRLDSCVKYLNEHANYPESEVNFIAFLTFACMVKDAIHNMYKVIGLEYPYTECNIYFKDIYVKHHYPDDNSFFKASKNPPADDKFFEYFRALAFAHPFETNRHYQNGLMQKGETQYAPWVIVSQIASTLLNIEDAVGVCIYSNKFDETLHLRFSFNTLKEYIQSRYNLINEFIKWAKNKNQEYIEKWKKRKVNRNQTSLQILQEIKEIIKERCNQTPVSNYDVDRAIQYLSCKVNDGKNTDVINKYRDILQSKVVHLCNAIDDYDFNSHDNFTDDEANKFLQVLSSDLKYSYGHFNYHLEKIDDYLPDTNEIYNNTIDSEDIKWGMNCVLEFAKEFAQHYVKIDIYSMTFLEIKLLVQIACYLERCNQEKGIIHESCISY